MMTWQSVCEFAKTLPGLEIGSGAQPGLSVRRKNIGWLREDGATMVVKVDYGERAALMREDPDTFFITSHYEKFPGVLVRLAGVDPEHLRELVTEAWRVRASKTQIRQFEGE
jgi:hypothetical protein